MVLGGGRDEHLWFYGVVLSKYKQCAIIPLVKTPIRFSFGAD